MNILAYCAVNPERRFPKAERQMQALAGIETLVFDDGADLNVPWYTRILKKYQKARWLTLAGGYDALLIAESDMLIPKDAALRLAALAAPVAYGVYCLRHGEPVWNICAALDEEAGFFLTDPIVRGNSPQQWEAALAGQPFPCYGAGFGTTLISKSVLERLDFRNVDGAASFYTDWLFAADCNRLGILQMCDPAVVCGHIFGSLDEQKLGVLYPDITMPECYRQEDLQ